MQRHYVPSHLSKCVNFNQSSSRATFTVPSSFDPANLTSFTFAADVFVRTLGGSNFGRIFEGNGGFVISTTSDGFQAQVNHSTTGGITKTGSGTIPLGKWVRVLFTWSDSDNYPTVYINGIPYSTSTTNKSGTRANWSGATAYLGNRTQLDRGFDGLMRNVCLWNRKLTQQEIEDDTHLGTVPSSGLILRYKMDEASGNLVDSSTSGISATPTNVTQNVTSYAVQVATEPYSLELPRSTVFANTFRGVNLPGLEYADGTFPGTQGTNYTQNDEAEYKRLSLLGFKVVRVPIKIERLQPTDGGSFDATYKGYINNQFTWAKKYGMQVWLDIHNYGGRYISGTFRKIGSAEYPIANYAAFIKKIAQEWKNEAGLKGVCLMNEPHDMPTATTSSNYNTTSTNYLMIQAAIDEWETEDTSKELSACTDGWSGVQNFFNTYGANPTPFWSYQGTFYYELHSYWDSNNSGQYSDRFAVGNGRDVTYAGDKLKDVAEWAKQYDVKLMIGEFGYPEDDESWGVMANDFLNVADEYNIPTFYWSAGIWANEPITLSSTQLRVVGKHLNA
jgi:endoglucanase